MTIEEVKNTLPTDENGNVFMEMFECYISPKDFITRFEGVELTHANLIAHPNTTTGWKTQFDDWQSKGIIL